MVFCFCRQPADKQPMVYCDDCEEWFHFRCVGLKTSQANAIQKLERYTCSLCVRFRSLESRLSSQVKLLEAKLATHKENKEDDSNIVGHSNSTDEQGQKLNEYKDGLKTLEGQNSLLRNENVELKQKLEQAEVDLGQCGHLTNVNKELEGKLHELEGKLHDLENLERQNSILKNENVALKQKLQQLEVDLGQCSHLSKVNQELELKLHRFEADLKILEEKNSLLRNENKVLKRKVQGNAEKTHKVTAKEAMQPYRKSADSSNIRRKSLSLSKVARTGSISGSQELKMSKSQKEEKPKKCYVDDEEEEN